MNPQRLLQHFDAISEAPDAVAKLRRFMLDLAVRGKLVEQEAAGFPGAIATATADRGLESEDPFLVPENWRWTRLGSICSKTGSGSTPRGGKNAYVKSGAMFLRSQNIYDDGLVFHDVAYIPESVHQRMRGTSVKPGDLLLNITGGSIGRCAIAPASIGSTNISQHVAIIRLHADMTSRFGHICVISPYFQERVLASQTGAGRGGLPKNRMDEIPVPVPPIPEQHRIVAKVDELMALCDQLQVARDACEQQRDRLVAASLHRLAANGTGDSDDTTDPLTRHIEHARFHLRHLPHLTTRAEHIKKFRQTILSLAVCGKLVEQNPNDEAAAELLKRIQMERNIERQPGNFDSRSDGVGKIEGLPSSWSCVPLIALGLWAIGSGFPKNEQGIAEGSIFFLKVSDMNLPGNEKYMNVSNNCIDVDAATRMRAKLHPPGTIIFPKIGGAIATNKRRILTRRSAIDNNCLGITFSKKIDADWAFLLLTTFDFTKYQVGTAIPALQQGVLERIPVGLPPLAEQHRIVARVDELMALCDQLEASLTAAQTFRSWLLDALLHEVLAEGIACGSMTDRREHATASQMGH